MIIDEYWWEDETTLCLREKGTGEVWRCLGTYPTKIEFLGLDSSGSCEVELTARYSSTQYSKVAEGGSLDPA